MPFIDSLPRPEYFPKEYNDNTWTELPGAAVWAAAGIDYSIWYCNTLGHFQMECCHQQLGQDARCLRSSMRF
jgi:hypothetical protein